MVAQKVKLKKIIALKVKWKKIIENMETKMK